MKVGIRSVQITLYMNGTEILSFTLETVPLLVDKTLAANNMKQEEIDLFVFHQANKYMMEFLRERNSRIDPVKFYYCMEKTGNTVSSTIPIALKAAMENGEISVTGKNVMLAGFGVGYSWGGTILRF